MTTENNIDYDKLHIPVLLARTIKMLGVKDRPNKVYVDCTLGLGGHSSAILKILVEANQGGKLICIDRDINNIEIAQKRLELIDPEHKFHEIHKANFSQFDKVINKEDKNRIGGVLFDLGVSSTQYDNPERGFSYRFDGPLDMRMDQTQNLTAYKLLAESDAQTLTKIFRNYGNEPRANEISKAIIRYRDSKGPLKTTLELEDVVRSVLNKKELLTRKHPAQKVFQAIRSVVNDENNETVSGIRSVLNTLPNLGRCVVISFNNEEDRLVKNVFNEFTVAEGDREHDFSKPIDRERPAYDKITKKLVTPTDEELEENYRARSAKLRGVVKSRFTVEEKRALINNFKELFI